MWCKFLNLFSLTFGHCADSRSNTVRPLTMCNGYVVKQKQSIRESVTMWCRDYLCISIIYCWVLNIENRMDPSWETPKEREEDFSTTHYPQIHTIIRHMRIGYSPTPPSPRMLMRITATVTTLPFQFRKR